MAEEKFKINGQYIKDFSFENPNAPAVFSVLIQSAPDIKVMVNINSVRLKTEEEEKKSFHEVMLHIDIKATAGEVDAFRCELKYCGIFSIENHSSFDEAELKRILLIEAPSLLFPFAREIIARKVANGGFSPLMLEPIDFETMFEKQSENASQTESMN